jgi:hypothetical protein
MDHPVAINPCRNSTESRVFRIYGLPPKTPGSVSMRMDWSDLESAVLFICFQLYTIKIRTAKEAGQRSGDRGGKIFL